MSKLIGALILLTLALAAGASATSSRTLGQRATNDLHLSCATVTSWDDVSYLKCSGEIPSFDGVGLDTDVSIPLGATAPRPTIVMLHGWGKDKTSWEANSADANGHRSWHWNNVWFVSQGWVVVNYTARGFQESCGITDRDTNCANGYTHFADRRFETRDTQTLLGKLVDAGIAQARQLAATGGSYGGGQTWLLATSLPWKSPDGVRLQLAAGVPMYGWTDLLDSLAPNGRANPLPGQWAPHNQPFGVPKQSFIARLFADGRTAANGRYDVNAADYGTDFDELHDRIRAGEPYDPSTDPVLHGIVDSYTYRNPYDASSFLTKLEANQVSPVPLFSVQGWTDSLFPAVQTLQMFQKLKAADPQYPIQMAFGDIGHASAQNPAWQWKSINTLAYRFLAAHVLGQGVAPRGQAFSFQTEPGTATPAPVIGPWNSLATSSDILTSTDGGTTTSAAVNRVDGAASNPVANAGRLHESASTDDPGAVYYTFSNTTSTHLLGLPKASLTYALTGQDAVVALKLWDEAPDGSKTLVTRGAYRLSTTGGDAASGKLTTYLFGNDWVFPAGDSIVLQVTQDDSPYLRSDNETSSISWTGLKLVLPVRS